jgi:hypothetical protein
MVPQVDDHLQGRLNLYISTTDPAWQAMRVFAASLAATAKSSHTLTGQM